MNLGLIADILDMLIMGAMGAIGSEAEFVSSSELGLGNGFHVLRAKNQDIAYIHHPSYEKSFDKFKDADDKFVAFYERKRTVCFFTVTLAAPVEDIWPDVDAGTQIDRVINACDVISRAFAARYELNLCRTRGLISATVKHGSLKIGEANVAEVRERSRGNKVMEIKVIGLAMGRTVLWCEYKDVPWKLPVVRRIENGAVLWGETDDTFCRLTRIFSDLA